MTTTAPIAPCSVWGTIGRSWLSMKSSICLAFDVYDVWRWWRCERFILGSAAAHRAGASRWDPGLG